jgi:hypothetical protein
VTSLLSPHRALHLHYAVSSLNAASDKQSIRHAVALSRRTVDFIVGQTDFTRRVIKLAKFWAKSNQHLGLKSVVVENVAIQAAKMNVSISILYQE